MSAFRGHDLLKKVPGHENYLLRFLYSTSFNVPTAFQRMKSFYELLVESPEWFAKEGPLSQKSLIEKDIRILTPFKDRGGRPIYLQKIGNLNPSTMQPTDVICIDDYWLEYALDDANGRENGMCIIIDLKKLSWRMMRWCTPYLTSTMLKKVDVLPVKEFKIHVVNSSFVANTLIKLIWPFVNDRIRKMVTFHFDGLESLHDFIEPHNLLSEYGGTATLDFQDCYEKLYTKNLEIRENFKTYRIL
ncbi:hypothetical protein MTP99_002874 [Tenebrio molitor]|nr:hypothetical protein MTP99_002874 [Tenebrio molitor]